jgi:hypothetical protein
MLHQAQQLAQTATKALQQQHLQHPTACRSVALRAIMVALVVDMAAGGVAVVAATAPSPTTMALAVPAAALTLGPCGQVVHVSCKVREPVMACCSKPIVEVKVTAALLLQLWLLQHNADVVL